MMQLGLLRILLGYTLMVTLLGNWFFALLRVDPTLVKSLIAIRDLMIFAVPIFIFTLSLYRKADDKIILMAFVSVLTLFTFSFVALMLDNVDFMAVFLQLRVLAALPIVIYITYFYDRCAVYGKSRYFNTLVKNIIYIFLVICIFEALFLVFGSYYSYLQNINFQNYMDEKGTQASIGAGLFGYRLLTPVFNPSVGGAILAVTSAVLFKNGNRLIACTALLLTILTVSKTGILILLLLLMPTQYIGTVSLFSLIVFSVFSFFSLDFLRAIIENEILLQNMASISAHMYGLRSGLDHIFYPLGIGNAGTILNNLSATEIGRESSLGMSIAILGFFYLIILFTCWLALKCKSLKIRKLFFFFLAISAVNEATGPAYFWITCLIITSFLILNDKERFEFFDGKKNILNRIT